MIILGIESATARAGVAIGTPDGVLASTQVTRGPRHAEILVPSIQFVCEQAGISLAEVDAIAVDVGPGLFTGLRVGIATANGLAQALELPMIGVCSLDLLAHPFRHSATDIVSVIDARRSEVY
ncbi:MAG: tRNA threonylcarbamoyladenosine biosynthesis protein TsaB, partial [Actinomycetota bacterium]